MSRKVEQPERAVRVEREAPLGETTEVATRPEKTVEHHHGRLAVSETLMEKKRRARHRIESTQG